MIKPLPTRLNQIEIRHDVGLQIRSDLETQRFIMLRIDNHVPTTRG